VTDIVPAYRGFAYVVANDRIIIVQRRTRQIGTLIPV
jgi:hypothetical protein